MCDNEEDIQVMLTIGQQLNDFNFINPDIEESQHCSQCDQFVATLKLRKEEILNSSAPDKHEMIADLIQTIISVKCMKLIL